MQAPAHKPDRASPLGEALPFITPDLPGTGGQIKQQPEHFVVEEVPLYLPSGEGPHLYLTLTRSGMTTTDVRDRLAALFHLRPDDVGFAGMKDKAARTTQTFSLPNVSEEDAAAKVQDALPVQVEQVARHSNKLKRGHLLGNRFRITIVQADAGALNKAQAILTVLKARGLPNYFGPQRFGLEGRNSQRGKEALQGRGPRDRWMRSFLISAYQSDLFNRYLTRRIRQGWFDRLLTGDVAKKTDTGGMFQIEDWQVEQPRFERGEITFTGPLYGAKMWEAQGEAGTLEAEILTEAEVSLDLFRRQRIDGTRRPGKLFLGEIAAEVIPDDGLCLSFFLPKGAYATVLLREVMKAEVTDGIADDE